MANIQLDHIVILLPYSYIVSPPKWITDNFTLTPGGRHGDNKTENKLIVFQDGSYLELIAFINDDSKNREDHFLGGTGWGVIAFAFTLKNGSTSFPKIKQEIHKLDIPEAWKPEDLIDGSRIKPNGETIRWKLALPQKSARGKAPFWCFDETPREKRVPSDIKFTTHPSGAVGVGSILIDEPESAMKNAAKLLDLLLPSSAKNTWDLQTMRTVSDSKSPQIKIFRTTEEDSKVDLSNERRLSAKLTILTNKTPLETEIKEIIEGDKLIIRFQELYKLSLNAIASTNSLRSAGL